jgi:hypothetical protein
MDEQFTTKFSPINYVDDAPMEENSDKLSDISSNLGSIVQGSIGNKNITALAEIINEAGTILTVDTVIGSTIKTGTSGQRTVIEALSGGLKVYNSDGTEIANLIPTDSGTLFVSTSPNTASRMFSFIQFIQQGYQSNPMVYLEAADVNVGTIPLSIVQKGDKAAITINHPTTSAGSGLVITHLGDAILGDFYLNNSDALSNAVKIRSTGKTYALSVEGQIGGISGMTHAAGSYAGYFKQFSKISGSPAHFSRLFEVETDSYSMVWFVSDRTSPDGLLTGGIGDICFNGDSGKVYYCTGSTAWTAL